MKHRVIILTIILAIAAIGTGVYFALRTNEPAPNKSGSTSDNQTGNNAAGQQQADKNYQIKVYFSKHPESDNDPSLTFAVSRTSPDSGVAKASITELLKGPSAAEAQAGFFTTTKLRTAASVCGSDFKLTVSGGVATLQFCKPFDHLGVVADGQADSEIKSTLKQFRTVQKVVILNYQGDCEFNLSGQNLCKQ